MISKYWSYNMKQLRDLCKELNVSKKGNKQNLVDILETVKPTIEKKVVEEVKEEVLIKDEVEVIKNEVEVIKDEVEVKEIDKVEEEELKEIDEVEEELIKDEEEVIKEKSPTPLKVDFNIIETIKKEKKEDFNELEDLIMNEEDKEEKFMRNYEKKIQEKLKALKFNKKVVKKKEKIKLKIPYVIKLNDPFIFEEICDQLEILENQYD